MGFVLSHLAKPMVSWLNYEKPSDEVPLSDFERIRYEIKPCDVLLVEGRTRISDVIRIITQSSWTHAALYVGRLHDIEDPKFRAKVADHFDGDPDVQLVIESLLGQGTIVRPLSDYQADHVRICRPSGLSFKDSQQAINFAISRLGLNYDVRQILDLARLLFPWRILPRRWRSSLFEHNIGRPTRTVCSTMIAEAFAYIQFPILPLVKTNGGKEVHLFRRNPKLCTPKDFDYSPYFEIIKYPFIDCCNYGSYRLLPWHGSGALLGEQAHSLTVAMNGNGTPEDIPADIDLLEEADAEAALMAEDANAQMMRDQDPLIEEIVSGTTPLGTEPTETESLTEHVDQDEPIGELEPADSVESDADEKDKNINAANG